MSHHFDPSSTWKRINAATLAISWALFCVGAFVKTITFGLGLGDVLGYAVWFCGNAILLTARFFLRKRGARYQAPLACVSIAFTMLILLHATLLRGREYPWNGKLFYLSCPTEIEITEGKDQKQELITMCSMEY